ncbi:putative alpha-beta superfamily hydrolase [Trichinella spiralis]|uniref:putative alpha-beta superfamily hydrolase n=1 Tax=Trichinella spiralis TaxID=6334 RepID=UPI0001EFD10D|nr:putative alpha-beta superfamily hydrolase [Trichinella spiralis]
MPTFSASHWLFADGIVGQSKSVEKEYTLGALFETIHAAEQKGGKGKREVGGGKLFDSKIFKPSPAVFQLLSFRQAFILSALSQIFADDESARPPGLDADCYSSQNGEHSDVS